MKFIPFAPSRCASVLALMLAGLTACSSTSLESSWQAPEVDSIHFTKILVIAVTPSNAQRRTAEDAMRAQITTAPVVTSYELLPNADDLKDRSKVAAAIQASGVDGIITMRLVSDDKEVTYSPPYSSFYGYYSRPYGLHSYYLNPGAVTTDRIIGIETNIYNARDEKLIWTGLTKTTNLTHIDQIVAEVAAVVRAKMREQKLIPEPVK